MTKLFLRDVLLFVAAFFCLTIISCDSLKNGQIVKRLVKRRNVAGSNFSSTSHILSECSCDGFQHVTVWSTITSVLLLMQR